MKIIFKINIFTKIKKLVAYFLIFWLLSFNLLVSFTQAENIKNFTNFKEKKITFDKEQIFSAINIFSFFDQTFFSFSRGILLNQYSTLSFLFFNFFTDFLLKVEEFQINAQLKKIITDQEIILEIWNFSDGLDVFSWTLDQFEKKFPFIKIDFKNFTDEENYYHLLLKAAQNKQLPDIFSIKDSWLKTFWGQMSPAGKNIFTPQEIKKKFFPLVNESFCTQTKVWAVPLFINSWAMFSNAQLLQDDRITLGNRPGNTWALLKNNIDNFKKFAEKKKKFLLFNKNQFDLFLAILLQLDILPTDNNFSKNDSVLETLNFLKQNSLENKKDTLNDFMFSRQAVFFGSEETLKQIKKTIFSQQKKDLIKLSTLQINRLPVLKETDSYITLGKSFAFAVSSRAKNVNAAWGLIKFLSSKKNMTNFVKKTNKTPARKDLQNLKNNFFIQNAAFAKSAGEFEKINMKANFQENFTNFYKNKITAEQFLKNFSDFFSSQNEQSK